MISEFDSWNEIKKEIQNKSVNTIFFQQGEVWWCTLGLNVGIEANGKNNNFERPVLIFKIFNKDMIWILPITSSLKDGIYYSAYYFNGRKRTVLLSQIRTISAKRLKRKIYTLPQDEFSLVQDKFIKLIV